MTLLRKKIEENWEISRFHISAEIFLLPYGRAVDYFHSPQICEYDNKHML